MDLAVVQLGLDLDVHTALDLEEGLNIPSSSRRVIDMDDTLDVLAT